MSDSPPNDCPFCCLPIDLILEADAHALAFSDAFPVSPGHTLIIPRHHVLSFFELTDEEVSAVHELLRRAKARLDDTLPPAGYNIGVNVGPVAGQTIAHVHVHLIPRFAGDVADPVGGVRKVIPGRGPYLATDSSIGTRRG